MMAKRLDRRTDKM
jgi:hypothetical protein